MAAPITLYLSNTCHFCADLKRDLARVPGALDGVTVKLIDGDPNAQLEYQLRTGSRGVPAMVIDMPGVKQTLIGKPAIEMLLTQRARGTKLPMVPYIGRR